MANRDFNLRFTVNSKADVKRQFVVGSLNEKEYGSARLKVDSFEETLEVEVIFENCNCVQNLYLKGRRNCVKRETFQELPYYFDKKRNEENRQSSFK